MPRRWPALSCDELRDCLRALGLVHDRTESSHEIWVHEIRGVICVVDVKWNTISGPTIKHIVEEQLKISRHAFYGSTRRTARKI